MAEKKYGVTLDTKNKVIISMASGFIKENEAKEIINQFKEAIRKANTSEYGLIVDGSDSKPVSPDVVPLMAEVIKLYTETPFKKKYFVEINSALNQTQIKRVGNGAMADFIIVRSQEEAIKSFNS